MRRMTRVTLSAPGGASAPCTAIGAPPGCASGGVGSWNRSRSRPGRSLGGDDLRNGSEREADHRQCRHDAAYAGEHPPTPCPANNGLSSQFYRRREGGGNRIGVLSTV